MTTTFGYTIIYVDDVRKTIDFYVSAFGMVEKFVTPEADYGELTTGATTLAFAASGLAASNLASADGFTPLDPSAPPPGITITLLTTDVPGTLATAVGVGARPYVETTVKPWGQTVAYVIDPNGVLVELATPVVPPES